MNSNRSDLRGPTPAAAAPATPAVQREEVCARATVRRVAAMLDLPPDPWDVPRALLPRGWHFVLMAADTRRAALRADGFPGLGVPMPDLGLPRLMLGGRTVQFRRDIEVGATLVRSSTVQNTVHKTTAAGAMVVVTLGHELVVAGQAEPALVETQTYLLLPARADAAATPEAASVTTPAAASVVAMAPVQAQHLKTVVPDETLLFQYSALGFNSHRIHLDRDHARKVEGFPDLVVNGGLASLLLTEFLRQDLGVVPSAIAVRHVAPLYCNCAVTLAADRVGAGWRLKAYDDQHRLAVDMEVTV